MKTTHNSAMAYGKSAITMLAMVTGTAVLMAACANVKPVVRVFSQDTLAEAIRVPAGHTAVLETTADGVLNYECRANATTAGTIGWVLVGPKAELTDRGGKMVANYFGPPATWMHVDGSSVTGTQVAIAPVVGATNIPVQLAKATPGANPGMLQNVSYIQRINTKGGQDFTKACTQADIGDKMTQRYQADYVFWRAM